MGKIIFLRPGTSLAPSLQNFCNTVFEKPVWPEICAEVREQGLQHVAAELARRVIVMAMEQEANELTGGLKGKHLDLRYASRHGYIECSIPYGAALMKIKRPRLRADGKEVPLSTYQAALQGALPPSVVLECCAGQSSQRGLPRQAECLQGTARRGFSRLSKSTINRHFVKASQAVAAKLQSRPLGGQRQLVLYLDGIVEKGHHVISVLGLAEDGQKRILGLREGSSESGEVCAELLRDLLGRGLDVGNNFVAVIDGGKGLASALKQVFGDRVLIQRCQAHKIRNVLEKVPQKEQAQLKGEINRAWASPDAQKAERMLRLIATKLALRYPAASRSLLEGLRETLTCKRLDLPHDCPLTKSLVTTNPLESLYARHTAVSKEVCRWRSGAMLLRWVATSLALAERSLGAVQNKAALQFLKTALMDTERVKKAAA